MTDVAVPLADTDDMVGLHRVFRQGVGDAGHHVESVSPNDTARAALVASYFDNVLRLQFTDFICKSPSEASAPGGCAAR